MGFTDWLLYRLARRWRTSSNTPQRLGVPVGTEAYEDAYALDQFNQKVRRGLQIAVFGREVLEVGCGHGGISCYLAAVGARRVVGVDINPKSLKRARAFRRRLREQMGRRGPLPVAFARMSACDLRFPADSFDLVVADNAVEHFLDVEGVLLESFRVLRPGGEFLAPIFSSIYSRDGLHLKHGLKMPWANVFFSERTIVKAMERLAREDPRLYDLYPGLRQAPTRVRDLRPHKDLNDVTYGAFRAMARRVGFEVVWFRPNATLLGKLVERLPILRTSVLMDVLSQGASALLRKPAPAAGPTAGGPANAEAERRQPACRP